MATTRKIAKFSEIYKKAGIRIYVWLVGLIVLLLVDEYVKEGYLYKLSDATQLFSHEFFINCLLAIILAKVLHDGLKKIWD